MTKKSHTTGWMKKNDECFYGNLGGEDVCTSGIRRFFDIPKHATHIMLKASTIKPKAVNAVAFDVRRTRSYRQWGGDVWTSSYQYRAHGSRGMFILLGEIGTILPKILGGMVPDMTYTIWVQCWYKEEE